MGGATVLLNASDATYWLNVSENQVGISPSPGPTLQPFTCSE